MTAVTAFYTYFLGRLHLFRRDDAVAVGELDSLGKIVACAPLQDAMRDKALVDLQGNAKPLTDAEHRWLKGLGPQEQC